MTQGPSDWEIELQNLRAAATTAGIRAAIAPEDFGIQLETADHLIARLQREEKLAAAAERPVDQLARRRRTRRRVLAASSIAAVGVLVIGVLQPWGASRVAASTPAILDFEFAAANAISYAPGEDPSETFQSLSDAAADAPAIPASAGKQHIVTDNWFAEIEDDKGAVDTALIPQISETWLSGDGSLRTVERRDKPLSANGRGLPTKGAWTDQPQTADETQPAASVDPDVAATLPTEAAPLRAALLARGGCEGLDLSTIRSNCLYQQVVDLSTTYVMPPKLNAAIWTVLGGEKGFRLLGSVKDRVGRDGVGISLIADDSPEYRQVLIADPQTGSILGNEEILIKPVTGLTITAPAITRFSAILESDYVD